MPKNNDLPKPVTYSQQFYAKAAGIDVDLPEAITPEQKYLKAIAERGESIGNIGDVEIDNPENGEVMKYDAEQGKWINGTASGGGGTSDYTDLTNKPKINNVTLAGNKSLADIGAAAASETYTDTEVDALLSEKADADDVYTKAQTDTELAKKVDKVTGKGLSTNDFTSTDKANLATALEKANAAAPQATTYTKGQVDAALAGKVDKVDGKGLSTEDFTAAEKSKLAGIAAGAEVNVQANWAQTSSSADDFIKNKPTLGAAASKGVDSAPTASSTNLVESGGVYTALAAKASLEDILGVGITITSNSSMDGLTAIGKWYCVNATTAMTVTNAPFTDAAYFGWTIRSIASSDRYIQIAIKNSDDFVVAKRRYSGVWSAWSYLTGTAVT